MVEHAQELIATINAALPPSAEDEEEEIVDENELEFIEDDDNAMEM